jgi:toxin ParE1/3/4
MRVRLSPEAIAELKAIQNYIAADNPRAASRIAVQLIAACDRLEHLPYRGRVGRVAGTRELTNVPPYVITYQIEDDGVVILHIYHGRQDR